MFGFGWGEMVVIGIVALIAIGPKELPTVLRTIGQAMGKVRRMANEFQGQFQEALREAELTDLKKQAEDMTSGLSNFDPMADAQKEVEGAFNMQDQPKDPMAESTAPTEITASMQEGATEQGTPAPEAPPLPEIDVPLPDPPPSLTEKDFAPEEPSAPPPKKTRKRAKGSA